MSRRIRLRRDIHISVIYYEDYSFLADVLIRLPAPNTKKSQLMLRVLSREPLIRLMSVCMSLGGLLSPFLSVMIFIGLAFIFVR